MSKKRGRPKKEVDSDMVPNVAMIGATIQIIAEQVGSSRDAIENRFRPEIEGQMTVCLWQETGSTGGS